MYTCTQRGITWVDQTEWSEPSSKNFRTLGNINWNTRLGSSKTFRGQIEIGLGLGRGYWTVPEARIYCAICVIIYVINIYVHIILIFVN